jgi:hypothetical protein
MIKTNRLLSLLRQPRPATQETVDWFAGWLKENTSLPFVKSQHDTFMLTIGKPNGVLFTAHYDTVDDIFMGDKPLLHGWAMDNAEAVALMSSPPYKCLGADDGAGIEILLSMAECGVQGTYMFFYGEEAGCLGSNAELRNNKELFKKFHLCLSFDRKGTTDIVNRMSFSRTGSEETVEYISKALGMGHKAASGSYTDAYSFEGVIPECLNISIGYENCHTQSEWLNISYMKELAIACTNVDWSCVPAHRDTSDVVQGDSYDDVLEVVYSQPELIAELLWAYGMEKEVLDLEKKTKKTKGYSGFHGTYGF